MVKTKNNHYFDKKDREKIRLAIHKAEKTTNGEIYAVFTKASDDYFFIACFMWTMLVFIISILIAFWLHYSWRDISLHYYGGGMLISFLAGIFYLSLLPKLRLFLTPKYFKKRICHANAVKQFLAQNVHRTKDRTAILLFVSFDEHYAEIIADTAIHEKVPQNTWSDMIARLIQQARNNALCDGYIDAIHSAGKILAQHFPPTKRRINILPDHIVEV